MSKNKKRKFMLTDYEFDIAITEGKKKAMYEKLKEKYFDKIKTSVTDAAKLNNERSSMLTFDQCDFSDGTLGDHNKFHNPVKFVQQLIDDELLPSRLTTTSYSNGDVMLWWNQ